MDKGYWISFLNSLHNITRNGKSKYTGMDSLNEIVNLLTIKFIEHRANELELDDDMLFTNIYNNYCTPTHITNDTKKTMKIEDKYSYKLWDLLLNTGREYDQEVTTKGILHKNNNSNPCVFKRLKEHEITRKYVDSEINKLSRFTDKHGDDIRNLIVKIQESFKDVDVKTFKFDAFGEAYEQFKVDEVGNSGKNSGQYFTRRDLVEFIIKEIKPTWDKKFRDPSAGTGGFLHTVSNYIKETTTDKNYKYFIKNNLYGTEILPEVYKPLAFNMLIHGINIENVTKGDSLANNDDVKYMVYEVDDYIGGNPPFGMSIKIDEIDPEKKYYPIRVKDSMCLFIQNSINRLKKGGKLGLVVDRGILNNGTVDGEVNGKLKNAWERKLREKMLTDLNVYKIIQWPTGIFSHTNFATSTIFAIKGEPTKEVEFVEAYFKKEDKGKGHKPFYLKEGIKVKIEDIKKKYWSLKFEDYAETDDSKNEEENEDKEGWIKLGDICNLEKGKTLTINNIKKGIYPVIAGGKEPKGYHNEFNRNENTIIISCSGASAGYVSRYSSKIWADDCFSVVFKDNINDFNYDFVHYLLKFSQYQYMKSEKEGGFQKGNGIPHAYPKDYQNILIPNLSLSKQEKIIEYLDEKYKTYKIEETLELFKDYKIFNLLLNNDFSAFDKILEYQDELPFLLKQAEKAKDGEYKQLYIKSLFNKLKMEGCEIKKLGDICNLETGEYITKSTIEDGIYGVYGGGDATYNINKYNRENKLVIAKDGVSKKCVRYIHKKFFLNHHGWTLTKFNKDINELYINNWLLYNQSIVYKLAHGGGQKGINQSSFLNLNIPIPTKEKQQEIVNLIDKLNKEDHHFQTYENSINTQIDYIYETIENMCSTNNEKEYMNEIEDNEEESNEESYESEGENLQQKKELTKEIKKVVEEKPKKTATKGTKNKSNVI